MRRKKIKVIIVLIFILICINVLFFSVGKLIVWHMDNKKAVEASKEAVKTIREAKTISLPRLKKLNNETVGWLEVKGTNIDYPVVQAKNNSYYLTHDYNKNYNSAGWIFMDYRNDPVNFDKNTIIYGHGRLAKIMFGTLKNILRTDWCKNKDNYYVKFYTNDKKYMWEVFSVYTIKTTSDYIQTSFKTEDEFEQWIKMLKKRSDYNFKTYVSGSDRIITLSTCYSKTKKVVMHAKLVSSMDK